MEKYGKDQAANAKTEKSIKEEFVFRNVNLISLLILMGTVTIAELMNTQKEELVFAMMVSPEIHPVKFVNSDVLPTSSSSTVFAEPV